MKQIPIYDETAPIACSIDATEIPHRLELVERMRASLAEVARTDCGLILHFENRPEVEADLERFVIDEKRCCEFWGFALSEESDGLTLRWDGPPAASDLIDRLHAYFQGDEPITALSALL